MKIAVTGALGHIGSELVRELPKRFLDCEIILIDNLLTQRFPSLFNMPSSGRYDFIDQDVTKLDLLDVFSDCDIVIHLAAITDATRSVEIPQIVHRNNLNATMAVAKACATLGIKMIYPSSTSVYGTQENIVDETCDIDELNPQSPYADCKLKEENAIRILGNTEDLKYVILRLGTIYGISPGMRFHTAVNKFCYQAAFGQPLSIWETAYKQNRPYLSLDDAISAIVFIIHKNIFDGETYNILSGNHTVQNVVENIREFVPDIELSFVKNKIMNQMSYEVSNTKFTKMGFKFKGDLRTGISKTLGVLGGSK